MKSLTSHIENILAEGDKPRRVEHPEDRASREKGIADAKEQETRVLADYGPLLARLVTVYADDAAKAALEAFREAFWTQDPPRLEALSGSQSTATNAGSKADDA